MPLGTGPDRSPSRDVVLADRPIIPLALAYDRERRPVADIAAPVARQPWTHSTSR